MQLAAPRVLLAEEYLRTHGRPLEQTLADWRAGTGTPEAVVAALRHYQNPDGGFGRALEPDLRCPHSSLLATTAALQVFRELEAHLAHIDLRGALGYVLAQYDDEDDAWPLIPPESDAHPHAPWWNHDGKLAQRFNGFRFNCRAELAGYLWEYPETGRTEFVLELLDRVIGEVQALEGRMEQHDLICAVHLLETQGLPGAMRARLLGALRERVPESVETDPAQWLEYGCQPLSVVTRPESPFADQVYDALEANLDFLIEQQTADGSWQPNWSWFGAYPEVWEQARHEWASILTLRALRILRAFGRV